VLEDDQRSEVAPADRRAERAAAKRLWAQYHERLLSDTEVTLSIRVTGPLQARCVSKMLPRWKVLWSTMRKVVDRNYLQSAELRDYLAESRKNRVVLTDYAAMEAFKGDALQNILTATDIIRAFPKQVVVLKSTYVVSTLKGRRCGFTRRMVDRGQTWGFPEWCEGLERAAAGNKDLQHQIIESGKEADAHLKRMRDDQQNYGENLDAMSKNFSEAELKALRKHEPITGDMFGKIQSHVLEMAAFFFTAHPHFTELPPARELPYTFIFRYAMAGYVVALRWMSVGGAKNVKPEKIRNDIVDATYAAYATYFQGLLSSDAGANEIYTDAKFLIGLFLETPPPPDHVVRRQLGS
jgi:hypothetical protein